MMLDEQLHRAALAGLTRSAPGPGGHAFALPEAAAELQSALAAQMQEQALWHAIAVQDLWQRAGFTPAVVAAATEAPPDERNCPQAAEDVLGLLLRGLQPNLMTTWLRQAREHGLRIPHLHLPALLELGMRKQELRDALMPLLDNRARWLIAQHPEWRERYGVAGKATADQWQHGNLAERALALRAMRLADPAAALAALQTDWATEPPENRAALLPCLDVKLSISDEDFLEAALDDKRKEVRSQAQSLLARLPDSRLVRRCIERLASIVSLKKKILLGTQLEVALPAACDKAMTRDGIGTLPAGKLGEKAAWLRDLVAKVPPSHWSTTWNLKPADAIALVVKQEFNQALLAGLIDASMRQLQGNPDAVNVEWYCALLHDVMFGRIKLDFPANLMSAFGSLPQGVQQELVERWLRNDTARWDANNNLVDWIRQAAAVANAPWPEPTSRTLLKRIQDGMQATEQNVWRLRPALTELATVLDVSGASYFEENWPAADWAQWPQWRNAVDEFLATLRFRHTMQRSFMETTG
jgi:hypothetical protein